MKILGLKVSGFAMLSDDFSLDLRTKARVNEEDYENEVAHLGNNLDCPRTYVFVGKNASGKSTILRLLGLCYSFLSSSRFIYVPSSFAREKISIAIVFLKDGLIYKYSADLLKPLSRGSFDEETSFCLFDKESLLVRKPYKNKNDDLFSSFTELKNPFHPLSVFSDVTMIMPLLSGAPNESVIIAKSPKRSIGLFSSAGWWSFFSLSASLKESVVRLLDDSILKLDQVKDSGDYLFTRVGEEEKRVSASDLSRVLSDGTIRGVELFSDVINALKEGKTLIIDEIEGSFHKNLVMNIIFLFNNAEINKKNATLIFSTHYSELLDSLRRRDSIFVCHREGKIVAKNVYLDFPIRKELSKSNLFDNNAFGTLANYDLLMKAKKEIINEISSLD